MNSVGGNRKKLPFKSTPATVIIAQVSEHQWQGRLQNPEGTWDTTYGTRVGTDKGDQPIIRITVVQEGQWVDGVEVDGEYKTIIQGGSKHSRRSDRFSSFKRAQDAILAWASRRFRVQAEV